MKKEYFIIHFGEDGITISHVTREAVEKLVKQLTEDSNKDSPFVDNSAGLDFSMGDNYPIYKYMILKGELVIPHAVETVVKYMIP